MKDSVYFEVLKDSDLYRDYFEWMSDNTTVSNAVDIVRKEFGVETSSFYAVRDYLLINPTPKDRKKFASYLMKTKDGRFKKASDMSKRWVELLKDVKYVRKPQLYYYLRIVGRWTERLFHHQNKLYGQIGVEVDGEIGTIPESFVEMKASEFYKIVETLELGK